MTKRSVTVLLTGGGAPGTAGSIHCLKQNKQGVDVRVVCVDVRGDVEGRYLADAFHWVQHATEPGYLLAMRRIVREEKVDVILPQTTAETVILSQNKEYFEEIGVRVAVSDAEAVRVANDKGLLMEVAKELGIPVPEFYFPKSWMQLTADAAKLGYPRNKVVVKPRVSNGMRGFRVLTEEPWDVRRYLSEKPSGVEMSLDQLGDILCRGEWPEILVSEFLPGREFSVDCFRGQHGFVAIPRVRERVRSGITMKATVRLREDLIEWCRLLAEDLNLVFAFGFQSRESKDGGLRLLEANCRIQGGMVTAKFCGANVVWMAVLESLGEPVSVEAVRLIENTQMLRYWGAIGVGKKRVISTTWGGG